MTKITGFCFLYLVFNISSPTYGHTVSAFLQPAFHSKKSCSVYNQRSKQEERVSISMALEKSIDLVGEKEVSKRRPAPNKYVALQWVVESVEKNGGSEDLVDALDHLRKCK